MNILLSVDMVNCAKELIVFKNIKLLRKKMMPNMMMKVTRMALKRFKLHVRIVIRERIPDFMSVCSVNTLQRMKMI